MGANASYTFSLKFLNNREYIEHGFQDDLNVIVNVSVMDSAGNAYKYISASVKLQNSNVNYAWLEGKGSAVFDITVNAQKYAS